MQNNIKSQRFIWMDIMMTLLALLVMEYFYYGVRAVFLCGVCVGVSLVSEIISLRLTKKRFSSDDLGCISDAVILSLMLPAVMDYKIAGIACIFACIAAKNILGGKNSMIFSPAAAGYVFLLTSWKNNVLMYTQPHIHTGIFDKADNLVSSASHAFNTSGRVDHTDFEILMGNVAGPTGTVSILLLAVCAVILFLRRDISAGAFIGTLTGTSILALIVPMCDSPWDSLKYTLSSNMVLFSAIYIISDKRIAPKKDYYAFFYGFFLSAFSYILILTTAKENVIVITAVIFAPAALGFRNLEAHIEKLRIEEEKARKDEEIFNSGEVYAEEVFPDE